MQRKSSSADVATRAGVSRTTVSYVLNGRVDASISAVTRERVLQAARDLSYRSNRLANGVLRGQTRMIGVVVPNLLHTFYCHIVQGIHDECDEQGLSVLLTHSRSNSRTEERNVELLMEYRVEGLVCVCYSREQSRALAWAAEVCEQELPCVLVDYQPSDVPIDSVISDDVAGARAAVEHLIGLGHRRIAHLLGDGRGSSAIQRYKGYRQALRAAQLPFDERLAVGGHYTLEEGARATRAVLDLSQPPTAIFAANDVMAEGARQVLAERGLQAPRDLSLVGYGNLDVSHGFGLSSVDQNPLDMGRRAVRCLLERQATKENPRQKIVVPTQLVVRQTCGAPASLSAKRNTLISLQPLLGTCVKGLT